MSGIVKRVKAKGPNVANLKRCLEQTAKRWRFPASNDSTETSIPFVFQPGG